MCGGGGGGGWETGKQAGIGPEDRQTGRRRIYKWGS